MIQFLLSMKVVTHPQAHGVTRQRLASYDRPIRDEPAFSAAQAPGLRHDLAEYLKTLKVTILQCLGGICSLQCPATASEPCSVLQPLGRTVTPVMH